MPLAPFFLSQMLEHHFSACYSCLDELPTMDADMHKSLSYIKVERGSSVCLLNVYVFVRRDNLYCQLFAYLLFTMVILNKAFSL